MHETLRLAAGLLAAFTWACACAATTDTPYIVGDGPDARTYVVSRPDSCQANCPLVMYLHGSGPPDPKEKLQPTAIREAHSGIRTNAEANGYVVVLPDGVELSWNAGRSATYGRCCGPALEQNIDDVAFLKDVVARVAAAYPVDRTRVYVTGWSAGCMMAQRLVAEASDVFTAVACTGGYLMTNQKSLARPVAVTEIHAFHDNNVEYPEVTHRTGARENAQRWAELDHCVQAPVPVRIGKASLVQTWDGCAGGVHVRLVTLARSGHDTYVNEDGVDLASLVWDSLRDERLPH